MIETTQPLKELRESEGRSLLEQSYKKERDRRFRFFANDRFKNKEWMLKQQTNI